jgi:Bifunctional DNA primase/polymerase, N-terminal
VESAIRERRPVSIPPFLQASRRRHEAKSTPWHPKLEFRGTNGILVLPPSLHKSGNRYAWAEGRSPEDIPLLEVPQEIVQALSNRATRRQVTQPTSIPDAEGVAGSLATMAFLSGKFANEPGWNTRLFNAACDLCGRRYPRERVEALLLAAAGPSDEKERDIASRTIESAFSQPRSPARR